MPECELGVLSGIRVADLTGVFGAYGPRLLADLGATVARLLPDERDPCASVGPFHPETGVSYFARFVNANKRSAVIPSARLSDSSLLPSVLEWADIVIEEVSPRNGWPKEIVQAVSTNASADAVVVSIRPFAEGSAQSAYVVDDLAAQALGGLMALSGDPHREPLALFGGQSYFIVGVHAAAAALIGLNDRSDPHVLRHYRVSVQEAIVHTLETAIQYYTTEGIVRERRGAAQQAGDGSYRAKDGNVVLGAMTDVEWGRLVAWLDSLGVAEAQGEFDHWSLVDRRNPRNAEHFKRVFERFAQDYSSELLSAIGQANRVLISPSYTLTQILRDAQLNFDGFFQSVMDSRGEHFLFPGPPYRISSGAVLLHESARQVGQDTEWFLAECLGACAG